MLVLNSSSPTIYTINLHLSRIPEEQILRFSNNLEWALFIACNRDMLGKYEGIETTALYQGLADMGKNKDFIIGPIADDNMTMVMQQFIDETITDRAFIECIKCIDLGMQYVAKTENACRPEYIEIVKEEKLSAERIDQYRESEYERRRINNRKLKDTRRQYKREGLYLEEILENYEKRSQQAKLAESMATWNPDITTDQYTGIKI